MKKMKKKTHNKLILNELNYNNYCFEISKKLLAKFEEIYTQLNVEFRYALDFTKLRKLVNKSFFVMLKNNKAKKCPDGLRFGDERIYLCPNGELTFKGRHERIVSEFDLIEEYKDDNEYYMCDDLVDFEFLTYVKKICKQLRILEKKQELDGEIIFNIEKEIKGEFFILTESTAYNTRKNLRLEKLNNIKLIGKCEVQENYRSHSDYNFSIQATTNFHKINLNELNEEEKELWTHPKMIKEIIKICDEMKREITKKIKKINELEQKLINKIPTKYNELIMIEELKK